MDKLQKGFALRPVVIVLAVLLIGGGVYSVVHERLTSEQFRTKTVLKDAIPLTWLDEQHTLVALDNKIVKYNMNTNEIVSTISDYYYFGKLNKCFSPEGGMFAINESADSRAPTSYRDLRYHWIKDWGQPAAFEELKNTSVNPFDCNPNSKSYALMRVADGNAKRNQVIFLKSESQYTRTVSLEKSERITEINLGKTGWTNQLAIHSSLDRTSKNYFWYPKNDDFDKNHNPPQGGGWWVSPDGKIIKETVLPNGPWIKEFSMIYTLRFWSCGPSCYSHMKIYTGNGQIYIYVWGEAVDDAVRGIYRLDDRGQQWNKIIDGIIDYELVISQSGCQLSYSVNREMQIMNVCKK